MKTYRVVNSHGRYDHKAKAWKPEIFDLRIPGIMSIDVRSGKHCATGFKLLKNGRWTKTQQFYIFEHATYIGEGEG